jgi:hypothetical protein
MDEVNNALSVVFFIAEVLTARLFSPQSSDKKYTLCVYSRIKFIVREIMFSSRPGNVMLRIATERNHADRRSPTDLRVYRSTFEKGTNLLILYIGHKILHHVKIRSEKK